MPETRSSIIVDNRSWTQANRDANISTFHEDRNTIDVRLESRVEESAGEKWVTDRDPPRRTRTVSPILLHACTLFHRLVSRLSYARDQVRCAKETHLHRLFLQGLVHNYAQSRG